MKDEEKQIKEIFDILNKFEFFQGQRAGRELWFDKPKEVQDKDIADFVRDIKYIRSYLQDSVVLSREEYKKLKLAKDICCHDLFIATKQSHEEGYKRGYDKGKYEASNETAEKIICIIKTFSYDKEFTKIITRIISERFGVEIKE